MVIETTFRPSEEKDRDAIKELLTLSFDSVYAKYAKLSFESLEQSLVAEVESKVIGVINWRIFQVQGEKIGYLFWLAIHPDFRRKAFGEKIMRKAIELLNQQRIRVIFTSIEKDNHPSRSLFKKLGFTRISKAEMRKMFGKDSPKLYREMWVMPWEDLFIMKISNGK